MKPSGTRYPKHTLEDSVEAPQKVKNSSDTWSSNLTATYISKEHESICQEDTVTVM